MNAGRPLSQPGAIQGVLDAFEQGESISDIAKRLGISHQAIYRAILNHAPEEWQLYRSAKALVQLDDAELNLDNAADGVAVSRVREQIKIAQWTLERTCRSIYGDRSELTVSAESMADLLMAVSERMLQERQVVSTQRSEVSDAVDITPVAQSSSSDVK